MRLSAAGSSRGASWGIALTGLVLDIAPMTLAKSALERANDPALAALLLSMAPIASIDESSSSPAAPEVQERMRLLARTFHRLGSKTGVQGALVASTDLSSLAWRSLLSGNAADALVAARAARITSSDPDPLMEEIVRDAASALGLP